MKKLICGRVCCFQFSINCEHKFINLCTTTYTTDTSAAVHTMCTQPVGCLNRKWLYNVYMWSCYCCQTLLMFRFQIAHASGVDQRKLHEVTHDVPNLWCAYTHMHTYRDVSPLSISADKPMQATMQSHPIILNCMLQILIFSPSVTNYIALYRY